MPAKSSMLSATAFKYSTATPSFATATPATSSSATATPFLLENLQTAVESPPIHEVYFNNSFANL